MGTVSDVVEVGVICPCVDEFMNTLRKTQIEGGIRPREEAPRLSEIFGIWDGTKMDFKQTMCSVDGKVRMG